MDLFVLMVLAIVVIAVIVAAIAWFGPRPKQWKTTTGRTTEDEELVEQGPTDDERPSTSN